MYTLARVLQAQQPRINAVLETETAALPPLVRDVARHTLGAGGKRLRPLLTILTASTFSCEHPDMYSLAAAVEFFHAATLLHDDILDNAPTRRGVAAAHTVFGSTMTILAGDAMLAWAAHMVARPNIPRLGSCFAQAIVHTAAGEITEFTHAGTIALSHEQYLEIITGKTAWVLRTACELAAIRAGASEEQIDAAARFGLELGIAFQIVDDALDIYPSKETGKPAGGDLREGKCTPLLRFYWESLPPAEAERFARSFADRSFTDAEIAACIKDIHERRLDKRTRELADTHLRRAEEALALLPAGKGRDMLALIPDFIRNRRS